MGIVRWLAVFYNTQIPLSKKAGRRALLGACNARYIRC